MDRTLGEQGLEARMAYAIIHYPWVLSVYSCSGVEKQMGAGNWCYWLLFQNVKQFVQLGEKKNNAEFVKECSNIWNNDLLKENINIDKWLSLW